MGREIIWSKEALDLLEGVLTYWDKRNGSKRYSLKLTKLFQDNLKQIAKFPKTGKQTKAVVQRTYKNIEIIAKFPNMGTVEDAEKGIRGFVISKHNTLFYRIDVNPVLVKIIGK